MAKTAQDYLREAQAGTTPKKKAPSSKPPAIIPTSSFGKSNKPQSPLNWLMDIVTRPLSGITNAVQSGVNGVVDAQKLSAKGDVGGAIGQGLMAANIPGNFLTGMFSDDPNKHRTFSKVLEESTDKIGSLDPKYVNRVDNVNPVLKGVAGFAGDVALDPLTYVPGAVFLKAGKGIQAGFKGAGDVSKAILSAKASKAAEKASADATKLPEVTPETALGATAAKTARIADEEAITLAKATVDSPPPVTPEDALQQSQLATAATLAGEKAKTIKAQLSEFKPQTIKLKPDTAATSAKAIVEAPAKFFNKDWLMEAEDALGTMKLSETPRVLHQGKPVPMPTLLVAASKGDKEAAVSLKNWHQDNYMPAFVAAKSNGHIVDAIGRKIEKPDVIAAGHQSEAASEASQAATHAQKLQNDPEYASAQLDAALREHAATQAPGEMPSLDKLIADATQEADTAAQRLALSEGKTTNATKTILTARGSFMQQLATKRDALEVRLGPQLVTSLKRNGAKEVQDARFDDVLSELHGILDGNINLHDVQKILPASDRMLKQLGIDFNSLPKIVRAAQDAPNPGPAPKKVSEALAMMEGGLDENVAKAAEKGLAEFVQKDIINVRKYPDETPTGVKLTTGENRVGNIPNELNQYKQVNILTAITTHWSGVAKKLGDTNRRSALYGRARARFMREGVMPSWRAAEKVLDQQGAPFVLGINQLERLPLSGSQVVDILDDLNPKGMEAYFWNVNTMVAPTNLLDAAYVAARGGTATEVEAAIRNLTPAFGKKEIPNNIVAPRVVHSGGKSYMLGQEIFTGDELVSGLRNTLMVVAPKLRAAAEANARAFEKRSAGEATVMLDSTLQVLEKSFAEGRIGDLLHGINDTASRVTGLGAEMGATPLGTEMAGALSKALLDNDVSIAKAAVKVEKAVKAGAKGKTATQAVENAQRAGVDDALEANRVMVEDTLKFDSSGHTLDLGDALTENVNASLLRKAHVIISRKTQMKDIHEQVVAGENIWRNLVGRKANALNTLSRQLTREQFTEGFRALQKGYQPTDPAILKALPDIDEIVSQIFGKADSTSLLDNKFFRNNQSIEHVNKAFKFYGLGDQHMFDAEKAAQAAKAAGHNDIMRAAADQWRDWDVKDPADFLNKVFTASAKIDVDQMLADTFHQLAVSTKATSKVPKEGYARIVNESGKSILAKYLPADLYYDKAILEQLHAADVLTQQSLDFSGSFGKFVRTTYKPVQDMWKTGVTVLNPTHHIRNMISDMSLTYLAEGFTSLSVYRKALHVMGARNSYSDFDAIKAINGIGEIPNAGRLVISKNARFPDGITADGLYSAMAQRGNLPEFHTLESLDDLTGEGMTGLQKKWTEFGHTKAMRAVGGLTEARDHYARVAHMIQILENPKYAKQFKTADEFLDFASARVRKWHPDGSDMSTAEQALKLVIPFYSWQRKTIPLVAEAMLTHPARVTVFPKASYALATSMGVNPDTLADPFPQDEMFPSYLTNQMVGPNIQLNGKLYGIDPGFAGNDILNTYMGANPAQSVLGSLSPLITTPFELSTGTSVGTGARINDYSDYMDSKLPVVGPVSRMSGNSVSGSFVSLMQGKGFDPQYQIRKGNKDPVLGPSIAATNWLLGAGISPFNQDNQRNYAEIEKRDREGGKNNGF